MGKSSTLIAGCFLCLSACAEASGSETSTPDRTSAGPNAARDAGVVGGEGADAPPLADGGLPPEVEVRQDFQTPRAGDRYVYAANPIRNTVAVVDSETLTIDTVEAGEGPTYLDTFPTGDRAIVLNVGSDDASILRTGPSGTRAVHLPVVPGANAIAMAPTAAHAVVYFDAERATGPGPRSFQDVTVLKLEEGAETAVDISVGFRPSEVAFTDDGNTALIITEDGVSVVDLVATVSPTIAPTIGYGDSVTGAVSRDVSISGDGRFAIARREGEPALRLIDLTSGSVARYEASSPVTDLDLLPAAQGAALAVLRDESAVLRIPIPDGFSDETTIERLEVPGSTVGSVSVGPGGRAAILYTTVVDEERATIVDLADFSAMPRTVRLRKSVETVAIAPDGQTVVVVHRRTEPHSDLPDFEAEIDRSFGYTLVALDTGFAKLQLTEAPVGPIALVPDGSVALLLFRSDAAAVREVHRVDLSNYVVASTTLGSPPLSLGILGATGKAFASQEHPEGRMTFIDWSTGETASVTGFELNSRIVE